MYLRDQLDARDLTPGLVLLRNHRGVIRLDPATGEVMWSRSADYLVHPPGQAGPLLAGSSLGDRTKLEVVNPATGETSGAITLDRGLVSDPNEVFWAGGSIIAFDWFWPGASRAIDPGTGRTRFELHPPRHNAQTTEVLVRESLVVVVGRVHAASEYPVWAFDPRTGAAAFETTSSASVSAPTVLVSDDAAHVYVQRTPDQVVRLDHLGQERGTLDGRMVAASAGYLALARGPTLVVLRHGVDAPVFTTAVPDEHHLRSVALSGDWLVYTDPVDGHLAWVDLVGGGRRRVVEAGTAMVVSTEAVGAISTAVGGALISGDRLYAVMGTQFGAWSLEAKR